jgi:hypothetical protein
MEMVVFFLGKILDSVFSRLISTFSTHRRFRILFSTVREHMEQVRPLIPVVMVWTWPWRARDRKREGIKRVSRLFIFENAI